MSNKLKKNSPGYDDAMKELRNRIKEKGGLNINPKLMNEYIKAEDKKKAITEDEFYDILSKLSEEGFTIYKISQISKGEESRAMMICDAGCTIAFVKDESLKNKEEIKTE